MKFAKLFTTEDGRQVLVTKDQDEQDEFVVKIRSDLKDGTVATATLGFGRDERERQAAFLKFDQAQAFEVLEKLLNPFG